MGAGSSKLEKDEPLRLCRERKRFISKAIDSRYDLAASHVAYVNSLKNIGVALRRYAEAETLIEPSAGTEVGRTTPSPVYNVEDSEGSRKSCDFGVRVGETTTVNCMRSAGGVAVSMRFSPAMSGFMDEEQMGFSLPPPPPPLPEFGGTWDYFDTTDNIGSFDKEKGVVESRPDDEALVVRRSDNVYDISENGDGVERAAMWMRKWTC